MFLYPVTTSRPRSLIRSPFTSDVNELINEFFRGVPRNAASATRVPALNVREDNQTYFVEAEVPGYSSEQVEVTVSDGALTIRAQKSDAAEDTQEESGVRYLRKERRQSTFERTLKLPAEIDEEKVEAQVKNGVLTVKVPKAESSKPRKIAVKVS